MRTAHYCPFSNIFFDHVISTLIRVVFSLLDAHGLDPILKGNELALETLPEPSYDNAPLPPLGYHDKDDDWEPPEYLTITQQNKDLPDPTDDDLEYVDDPCLDPVIVVPECTDNESVRPLETESDPLTSAASPGPSVPMSSVGVAFHTVTAPVEGLFNASLLEEPVKSGAAHGKCSLSRLN